VGLGYATLALAGILLVPGNANGQTDEAEPQELGIVEQTGRRLFLLDVTIRAKDPQFEAKAARLTKQDFLVSIDRQRIPVELFEVDNLCRHSTAVEAVPQIDRAEVDTELQAENKTAAGHVVLYLDFLRLRTLGGRDSALAMVENLIPELTEDGNRVQIVANTGRVMTLADWNSDPQKLLAGLAGASGRDERHGADANLSTEEEISSLLATNQIDQALLLAKERNLAQQRQFGGAIDQFAMFVGEMHDVPRPKAIIYFADTIYANRADVVENAINSGVRIYGIKADGMTPARGDAISLADDPDAAARTSLGSLARRTGGRVAYGHFKKSAIDRPLRYLREDISCVYLISLDVSDLDRDRYLSADIDLRQELRKSLSVHTIPRIAIPSRSRQRQQAAHTAFVASESRGVQPATVAVIPVEVAGSEVTALVQCAFEVDAGPSPVQTSWDIGIVSVGRSGVVNSNNCRVKSDAQKIVFETAVKLPLEDYFAEAVAQEINGMGLARGQAFGTFIKPAKRGFDFLHPIVVMQKEEAVFVFERTKLRHQDWLALPYGMAYTDLPTSMRSVLCRGRKSRQPLTVERSITLPHKEIGFDPSIWHRDGKQLCLAMSDKIAAHQLPWDGRPYQVTYSLKASDPADAVVHATAETTFWVIGPAADRERY